MREESNVNKCRQRARLEVSDEGDACEMSARMLGRARSLSRAAEILDETREGVGEGRNREDFSAGFHGGPILWAQSAEIALKALWYIGHKGEGGEPPRVHDLRELHDGLPETVKKRLAEEFPEIRDPRFPQLPIPVRKGLRTILKEHQSALEEWRYSYELDYLTFEKVFGEVVGTLIDVGWQFVSASRSTSFRR